MDWKALVGSVAPWIGTALGGPLGGAAIGAVSDALGLSDKTETSLKAALSGVTPEQMLAIKNADNAFAMQMQQLGYENLQKMEELASSDRNSARQREMTVKDVTPRVLAYTVTLGFFALLTVMIFCPLPKDSATLLNVMIGSLGTAWTGIVAYYFGTSSSSARKTELLAQAQPIESVK